MPLNAVGALQAALERAELLEAQRLMDEATDGDEAWLPSGGEWDG